MKLIKGNCIEVLKTLEENSVDSVVTDPPYEIGFMGKSWDSSGIANNPEMWKECLRVLKPGGYLLSFSATRTYHRMAVGIEDAGFEIRDMIEWLYGSGFPKSHNIGKAVDKLGQNPYGWIEFSKAYKKIVEESQYNHNDIDNHLGIKASSCYWARTDHRGGLPPRHHWEKVKEFIGLDSRYDELYDEVEREIVGRGKAGLTAGTIANFAGEKEFDLTKGTSEYEGWGTALKPAHEPICMARKPLAEKTVAKNCLEWGTGGINIDESRIFSNNLQGNDFFTIFVNELLNNELCQLNHLNLPANSVGKLKLQQEVTNVIKKMSFVVGNVDMPILEKTLGKIQEDTIKKGMLCSDEILTESMNINLNTFIFGKSTTEKYQKDMKYIISTVLKMITDWKIYNVSAYQLIEVLLTKAKSEGSIKEKQGRFPSNFIHDNSEEVRACFPETNSGGGDKGRVEFKGKDGILKDGLKPIRGVICQPNSGNASRFFKSIIYQAKPSKKERNAGCEGLEEKETKVHIIQSEGRKNQGTNKGFKVANNHPTVKPIALMEYLIKMVTPQSGIVLDPFMGSGTTGCASVKNGFDFIGIDLEDEYIKIATSRIKHYKIF